MIIRFAKPSDSVSVAPLMFQAMEEIVYKLIGKQEAKQGISFLKHLFEQEKNQYSYQNTIVIEDNFQIVGSLVFYKGSELEMLRKPVLDVILQQYGQTLTIEDETQAGETYIDTLSVLPEAQGKGIGSKLIRFLLEYVKNNNLPQVGLLVDVNNPEAERLYTRLGFEYQNEQNLAGGVYKHLIYNK